MCVCVTHAMVSVCLSVYVGEQLGGVSSLLPFSHGSWGLNSQHQVCIVSTIIHGSILPAAILGILMRCLGMVFWSGTGLGDRDTTAYAKIF